MAQKISKETKDRLWQEISAFAKWLNARQPIENKDNRISGTIYFYWQSGLYDELLDYMSALPIYKEWVDSGRPERYISPEEEEFEERIEGIPELPEPPEPIVPEPLDPVIAGILEDLKIKVIRDETTGKILAYIFEGNSWTDPQEAIDEVNKIRIDRLKLKPEGEELQYGEIQTINFAGVDYTGQYDQYGRFHVLPGGVAQPTGVAALSPQEQALATMGIFKNEAGQFVDEFGMVLGDNPEAAKAQYLNNQQFERYLSERLTPYQQEQLALEKERMRLSQRPTLGEITQASIMEKQAWMSPFAAPIPWATRWSAAAGGEYTPLGQAPPIQSPVLNPALTGR